MNNQNHERERRRKHPRPNNKGSLLLEESENEILFSLLGNDNYTLASAVVQLLVAKPPETRHWTKMYTGIVCLVKDYAHKAYFLRMYDIARQTQMDWEQQLYEDFLAKQSHRSVLTFEGDAFMVGLSFANDQELSAFKAALDRRCEQEQRRKPGASVSISQVPLTTPGISMPSQNSSQGVMAPSRLPMAPVQNVGYIDAFSGAQSAGGKKNKKQKGKKLTKEDISLPTNFQHKAHVGWTPANGFEARKDDEAMDATIMELLASTGYYCDKIGKRERKVAYQVIEQHGGLEAAKLEVAQRLKQAAQPPPPPQRAPPAPLATSSPQVRHAVPQSSSANVPAPPPRDPPTSYKSTSATSAANRPLPSVPSSAGPSRGAAFVSPPVAPQTPPKCPAVPAPGASAFSRSTANDTGPPPPQGFPSVGGAPPPPPPPPPPPGFSSAPPPPPPPMGASSAPKLTPAPDSRSNLLEEITRGKQLRPVSSDQSITSQSGGGDSRGEVLSEIRKGVNLKPVERSEQPKSLPVEEMGGIAGALARALAGRRGQLTESDSSSDDDDDEEGADEDDWDDH